jgi:GNAT superfamily N-acetyltransferase
MPPAYTIRKAVPSDIPQVIELCIAHAAYEQYPYTHQGQAINLQQALLEQKVYCLIVEIGGKLVGYATYMPHFSTWEAQSFMYLDCLFLQPEARNQGIGEEMIKWVMIEAAQLNCWWMEWQTPDFNERAIQFYTRLGAKPRTKERFTLQLNTI